MRNLLKYFFIISIICLTSCDEEDIILSIEAPESYIFTRGGESSVNLSNEIARIAMAEEIISALKDDSFTVAQINEMFKEGTGFNDASLDSSGEQVRSKVGASNDLFSFNTTDSEEIKEDFDSYIIEQVDDVFSNYTNIASAGIAGQLLESNGTSVRYVNSQGVELDELFSKALIGGLMADQIMNHYTGIGVLDAGTNIADNDANALDGDNNYTSMEHNWDEAYGYLYGGEVNPAEFILNSDNIVDVFLHENLRKVDADSSYTGIAEDVYKAFILGRAAIVAKDYEVRDEQAEIIRASLSKVIAIRAIYSLQAGKTLLEADTIDYGAAFHDLSKGLGFIYSLQFTRQPNSITSYYTKDEVDAYLTDLIEDGNGLWEDDITIKLETISQEIADTFGLDLTEVSN